MGESYLEAAQRETKEEAGINLDLELITSFIYDKEDYKSIFKVYTTKQPVDVTRFKADSEEVDYFQEFTLRNISKEIETNPNHFAPTFLAALPEFITGLKKKKLLKKS